MDNESARRLGINLPTPFVEIIELLKGDSGADEIRLTVNLYLPGEVEGTEPPTESLAALSDLSIYAVFAIGNGDISQILLKERYADLCYFIANYEVDGVYSILSKNGSDVIEIGSESSGHSIYQQISIADFEYVDASNYDETRGIWIYKYTTQISLTIGGHYESFSELFDDVYVSEEEGVTYKDLSVFCFSSIYDFGTPSGDETLAALQNYYFFNSLNSDIAYEKVFVDGMPYDGIETVFKYPNGSTVHESVIQSLDGQYRAPTVGSGISLSLILSDAQILLQGFRSAGTGIEIGPAEYALPAEETTAETAATATTTQAGEIADSISTIVAEEQMHLGFSLGATTPAGSAAQSSGPLSAFVGYTPLGSAKPSSILVTLQQAAAAIPDKSTTTTTGQLYNSLAGFVGKTNKALQSSPVVSPGVVRNIKVLDIREQSAFADYEASDVDTETVTDPSADPIDWDTTPDRIYGQPD